ncbi:TetR-like C-terminal domain-containing protein [Lysinibacillus sp. NPDC096418]|uniref:TetR/AcrR family transcriptional regulator n=1 Tax=Lysinibacillus sp. NPDC096418 TaxID=3364138 RepID=UPI003810D3E1
MSNHKKQDPRALRSKKMLKNALFSLLAENQEISQLTVQKITSRAELNRATFYLHYDDINDLLRKIVQEIFYELSLKVEPLLHVKNMDNHDHLTAFLDYIYEYRKIFAVLIEQTAFKDSLFKLIKNMVQMRRQERNITETENTVAIEIIAASLLGIITWWIKDGIQYSSEYIAKQITSMYKKNPL